MPYSVINVCGSFSISFHLHLHCCVIKIYGCMQKEFPIKTTIQKGTVYEKLHHHHLFELSHCYVFISFYIIDNRIITSFNQKKNVVDFDLLWQVEAIACKKKINVGKFPAVSEYCKISSSSCVIYGTLKICRNFLIYLFFLKISWCIASTMLILYAYDCPVIFVSQNDIHLSCVHILNI